MSRLSRQHCSSTFKIILLIINSHYYIPMILWMVAKSCTTKRMVFATLIYSETNMFNKPSISTGAGFCNHPQYVHEIGCRTNHPLWLGPRHPWVPLHFHQSSQSRSGHVDLDAKRERGVSEVFPGRFQCGYGSFSYVIPCSYWLVHSKIVGFVGKCTCKNTFLLQLNSEIPWFWMVLIAK
jgi:hypothetical protein